MWERGLELPFPDTTWKGWQGKGGEALRLEAFLRPACNPPLSRRSPLVTPEYSKVAFCTHSEFVLPGHLHTLLFASITSY